MTLHRHVPIWTVLIASSLLAGCLSHGRVQTTRHLEPAETVTSGSLTTPGTSLVPRVSVQHVVGHPFGDVDVYIDSDIATLGTGVGTRVYLGRVLHAEVDLQYRRALTAETLPNDPGIVEGKRLVDVWNPSVGVETSVESGSPVYYGIHLRGRFPGPETMATDPSPVWFNGMYDTGLYPTLTFGWERTDGDLPMQFEVTVPKLYFEPTPWHDFGPAHFDLAFAVNF